MLDLLYSPIVVEELDIRVCALLCEQVVDSTDPSQPKLHRPWRECASLQQGPLGVGHQIVRRVRHEDRTSLILRCSRASRGTRAGRNRSGVSSVALSE